MLTDPGTMLGLSDGGAHCSSIVDASVPSWMLIHWGRDRKRGPGLPLETAGEAADQRDGGLLRLPDRGRLAPGKRADVNVIDFSGLRLHMPEVRYDLPAGGRRLVQRVDGYRATFVAGTPVFEQANTPGRRREAGARLGAVTPEYTASAAGRVRAPGHEDERWRADEALRVMTGEGPP